MIKAAPLLLLALVLQTQPAPKDPRQTTIAFLDAALNGRLKEAAAMADPSSAYAKEAKINEFAALKIKTLALSSIYANTRFALAITAPVTDDRNRTGPLVLDLTFKDNRWLIRDVDLASPETASDKLKSFTDRFKDATPVRPK